MVDLTNKTDDVEGVVSSLDEIKGAGWTNETLKSIYDNQGDITDFTTNIPKFGGNLWFVSKDSGSDANDGNSPADAFETIGKAITEASAGDAITVMAGVYTETGIDLNKNNTELWFEIGAILRPATGTALTVSGNYCRVTCRDGALLVDPAGANATGVLVTGNFVYLAEIRAKMDGVGDLGFDLQGDGADLRRCRCANPLVAAFKIQGDTNKLENCCTGGNTTSIGFWITNSCDKARLKNCGSQGHETAGYQMDAGVTNAVVEGSYSGGGDGAFKNSFDGAGNIFTNFHFDGSTDTFNTPVVKTTAFSGAATEYNIFKITGIVRIIDLVGHVTTVIPNTSSNVHLSLYSTGGEVDLTKEVGGPDLDSLPVGSLIIRKADSSEPMDAESSATPAIVEFGRDPNISFDAIADADQDTYIRLNLTAALASGAIHWHCLYMPISDQAFVEPA